MKKSLIIKSAVIGGSCVTIVVPPIVIAAVEQPIGTIICNDAIEQMRTFCKIPHCSEDAAHPDNLKGIADYIKNEAAKYLSKSAIHCDEAKNIWIDIPATEGLENCKKLVLQGHIDMVWDCIDPSVDKWTTPVADLVIDDVDGVQTVHGKDWWSNIGLDNGVAIATMLSLIKNQNKYVHGPIRCIFTVNEENGGEPTGHSVGSLPKEVVSHDLGFDYLVNLDTGPIGNICFNSGGYYPADFNTDDEHNYLDQAEKAKDGTLFTISITGGSGGHSGVDIADSCNTIYYLVKTLNEINDGAIQISSFHSIGYGDTKIPDNATVSFVWPGKSLDDFQDKATRYFDKMHRQKFPAEKNMKIEISDETITEQNTKWVYSANLSKTITSFISNKLEVGPLEEYPEPEEAEMPFKVSGNLGILELEAEDGLFKFNYSNRYQERAYFAQYYLADYIELFEEFKNQLLDITSVEIPASYENAWDTWNGNKDGVMAQLALQCFKNQGIKNAHMVRVHGGLECADFLVKNPDIDVVSIGPSVLKEHNRYESMALDSYVSFNATVVDMIQRMRYK